MATLANQNYQIEPPSLTQLLCSIDEASKTLGVSHVTIYALAKRGALPLVKFGTRCTRVRYSDLERLAAEGYNGPLTGTETVRYNPTKQGGRAA